MHFDKQTFGSFFLPNLLANQFLKNRMLQTLFSQVLIVRAEADLMRHGIKYMGVSPWFKELRDSELWLVPEYDVVEAQPNKNEYFFTEYATEDGDFRWRWYLDLEAKEYYMRGFETFQSCMESALRDRARMGYYGVTCPEKPNHTFRFEPHSDTGRPAYVFKR